MATKEFNQERQLLVRSTVFPFIFLVLMWIVFTADQIFNLDLGQYGIVPLTPLGLIGILTSPLLHANLAHIAANSIPFFLLFAGLFYYYHDLAWKIIFYSWLMTGIGVWCFARGEGSHIGASGIIYSLALFHFVSGIIRKNNRLAAFSLLVTFLYGSLVWGVFPNFLLKENISWESHLMGGLSGIFLALYFRNEGPNADKYSIDEEEESEDEDDDGEWRITNDRSTDENEIKI